MGVVPMQAPSVRAEASAPLRIVANALAIDVARLAWADTAARVS